MPGWLYKVDLKILYCLAEDFLWDWFKREEFLPMMEFALQPETPNPKPYKL